MEFEGVSNLRLQKFSRRLSKYFKGKTTFLQNLKSQPGKVWKTH